MLNPLNYIRKQANMPESISSIEPFVKGSNAAGLTIDNRIVFNANKLMENDKVDVPALLGLLFHES